MRVVHVDRQAQHESPGQQWLRSCTNRLLDHDPTGDTLLYTFFHRVHVLPGRPASTAAIEPSTPAAPRPSTPMPPQRTLQDAPPLEDPSKMVNRLIALADTRYGGARKAVEGALPAQATRTRARNPRAKRVTKPPPGPPNPQAAPKGTAKTSHTTPPEPDVPSPPRTTRSRTSRLPPSRVEADQSNHTQPEHEQLTPSRAQRQALDNHAASLLLHVAGVDAILRGEIPVGGDGVVA